MKQRFTIAISAVFLGVLVLASPAIAQRGMGGRAGLGGRGTARGSFGMGGLGGFHPAPTSPYLGGRARRGRGRGWGIGPGWGWGGFVPYLDYDYWNYPPDMGYYDPSGYEPAPEPPPPVMVQARQPDKVIQPMVLEKQKGTVGFELRLRQPIARFRAAVSNRGSGRPQGSGRTSSPGAPGGVGVSRWAPGRGRTLYDHRWHFVRESELLDGQLVDKEDSDFQLGRSRHPETEPGARFQFQASLRAARSDDPAVNSVNGRFTPNRNRRVQQQADAPGRGYRFL